MALIASHVRHRQQIHLLRENVTDSRTFLREIEDKAAALKLVELNPWIWDDPDCALTLNKNDIHFAILYHWRNQQEIDFIVGTPGYSLDFAARALALDDLTSVNDLTVGDFVAIAKRQLTVDYGRTASDSVWDLLTDTELVSFGQFLDAAAKTHSQNGG